MKRTAALHELVLPLVGSVSSTRIFEGVLAFVVSLVGSILVAAWVLSRLPADYLRRDDYRPFADVKPPWLGKLAKIGKNLLGAALVLLGIVLSLPGVPGQGLLTILIGIVLLDVPGKRKLEHRMMARPGVLHSINRLRARFGKPPMLPREDPALPPGA